MDANEVDRHLRAISRHLQGLQSHLTDAKVIDGRIDPGQSISSVVRDALRREAKVHSHRALAARCGISDSSLSRFLSGGDMRGEFLTKAARAVGIETIKLVSTSEFRWLSD